MNTYKIQIRKLLLSLQKEVLDSNKDDFKVTIRDEMKFKVNGDVELSRAIRAELVRLGVKEPPKTVYYDNAKYLYSYPNAGLGRYHITRGLDDSHYSAHEAIETTLEELKLMEKDNGK